jgi:hypothetical protein
MVANDRLVDIFQALAKDSIYGGWCKTDHQSTLTMSLRMEALNMESICMSELNRMSWKEWALRLLTAAQGKAGAYSETASGAEAPENNDLLNKLQVHAHKVVDVLVLELFQLHEGGV